MHRKVERARVVEGQAPVPARLRRERGGEGVEDSPQGSKAPRSCSISPMSCLGTPVDSVVRETGSRRPRGGLNGGAGARNLRGWNYGFVSQDNDEVMATEMATLRLV